MKKFILLSVFFLIQPHTAFSGIGFECPNAEKTALYGKQERIMRTQLCTGDTTKGFYGTIVVFNSFGYRSCPEGFLWASNTEWKNNDTLRRNFLSDVCKKRFWEVWK